MLQSLHYENGRLTIRCHCSRRRLKVELGEGEQVSALIENSNRSVDGTLRKASTIKNASSGSVFKLSMMPYLLQ